MSLRCKFIWKMNAICEGLVKCINFQLRMVCLEFMDKEYLKFYPHSSKIITMAYSLTLSLSHTHPSFHSSFSIFVYFSTECSLLFYYELLREFRVANDVVVIFVVIASIEDDELLSYSYYHAHRVQVRLHLICIIFVLFALMPIISLDNIV